MGWWKNCGDIKMSNILDKIEMEDMEFYELPDFVKDAPTDVQLEFLADKFKSELTFIDKKFAFNEDDDDFIPLRKYYNTAIKLAVLNDKPTDYDKYNILKKDVGFGLEIFFYFNMPLKKLVDDVYDMFFIDRKHPHLYNSTDSDKTYSLNSSQNFSEYSWMGMQAKTRRLQKPSEDKKDKEMWNKIDMGGLDEIYREKWNDVNAERIVWVYSYFPLQSAIDRRKSIEDMIELTNI
jgi:hypothetical protein